MECKKLNWLCKHIKKVSSSQANILVLNWVKTQFFFLWVLLIQQLSEMHGAGKVNMNINFASDISINIKNDNFRQCISQDTIWEFLHFIEKSWSVLEIFKFYFLDPFINSKSCKVVKSISTQGRKHFWMYLLKRKSFSHETYPINNILRIQFVWFGGLGPETIPFLIYQLMIINQKPIMMNLLDFTVLKKCTMRSGKGRSSTKNQYLLQDNNRNIDVILIFSLLTLKIFHTFF